jgi:hypothetical protein
MKMLTTELVIRSGHIVFKLIYRALLVMIRKAVNELYAASGLDYPAAIGKSP